MGGIGGGVRMIGSGFLRGGLPTLNLDLDAATFTAAMAKRDGPGPFAAAPIVQGSLTDETVQPDVLSFSRGTQVFGHWYDNFDAYQGGGFLIWTPEQDAGDISGDAYLWYVSSDYYLKYDHDNTRYELSVGGQTMTAGASITAGTKEFLAWGFDCANDLDGTNYAYISRNDAQTYGCSTQPTASAPDATIYVGSNGTQSPANGIIEGLVFVREVPWTGSYGTDMGNGDVVAAHHNSGDGEDVALTIGAWGTTFSLPTDTSVGELSTGTGEAWMMPHRIGNVLTDAFCETTYGSSGWATKGTPSDGPKDIATATEQLFGVGGYEFTVDADTEGIEQSLTGLDAGENYAIRVIAHEDDSNDIRVRVTDDTNSADIVTFTFGSGSSRDAPGVALFTFELPTNARNGAASDCTAITVSVEGTNAGQTVYVQQVELYENLVDNPSLETGAGDPWIPDGWTNDNLDSGDSEAEAGTVHSGSGSLELNPGANEYEFMYQVVSGPSARDHVAVGAFLYGDGTRGARIRTYQMRLQATYEDAYLEQSVASWRHVPFVASASRTNPRIYIYGNTGDLFADDFYVIPLTAVSLTATPQPEADATQSGFISVTGRDTLEQSYANLSVSKGRVRFQWKPWLDAADAIKTDEADDEAYIAELYGDADDYIRVYWSAANTVTMACQAAGGGESTDTWDATGAVTSGTAYQVEVKWRNGVVQFKVDGTVQIEIDLGANFGSAPTLAHFGHSQSDNKQGDAYYGAP